MEKEIISLQLAHLLGESFKQKDIYDQLEKPKYKDHGDVAFPCFSLAKHLRTNPKQIAEDLSSKLDHPILSKSEAVHGYVNIFLDQDFMTEHILSRVLTEGYGSHSFGRGENVVIDLSAPNIAKPFSMGHLRSTVIGNSLANLAETCGYTPVKINYIGDYGTQFGHLLAAYKKWGDAEAVRQAPLKELSEIYVRFHHESESDPSLIEEGREWFKRLEQGDEEALALWKWFRELSLEKFQDIYDQLDVSFDLTRGESYYSDKMETTISLLESKGLLEESDGALVVKLDEFDLPPCLIVKSNGTTTYATRDVTAAIDRYQSYSFSKSLYVVGNEQTLHFQQIRRVLEKAGFAWANDMYHVSFGMMLQDGKKMSTRKGRTILLEDVLKEAGNRAGDNKIGTGAVLFHDLKHYRQNDVEFSLEDMLTFEGITGPYLQYTYARALSLLNKTSFEKKTGLSDPGAWELVKQLHAFPDETARAFHEFDPSIVARYLLGLAKYFNQYYAGTKILQEDQLDERLTLVYGVTLVLKEGLGILGIEAVEEM
ncbi:arginine--tRNA ligase [Salimicrobium halophilum]|uniref:Arginine--tRNA ligase n=1 Tax=Salimicrobium halophilum TaxID=86666 RepID=A0A1G8U9B0_9BACI|nr:arginine--tRNA ligase [Salimicrobium halophilum]SDJ50194.1 arginyl-tRNA synthetase [Salimicrobium halophilum]